MRASSSCGYIVKKHYINFTKRSSPFQKSKTKILHVLIDIDLLIREGLNPNNIKGCINNKILIVKFQKKKGIKLSNPIYLEKSNNTEFLQVKKAFQGCTIDDEKPLPPPSLLNSLIFHNYPRTIESIEMADKIVSNISLQDTNVMDISKSNLTYLNKNQGKKEIKRCNGGGYFEVIFRKTSIIKCPCKSLWKYATIIDITYNKSTL